MQSRQLGLFGVGVPDVDRAFTRMRRVALGLGAWIDHQQGWLSGDERLFATLEQGMQWWTEPRQMYDRVVDTPRLLASVPRNGPGHPLLEVMRDVLSARYGQRFTRLTMALYRDGQDSVAFHGDTTARDMVEAVVATVSLGAPRRFILRPTETGAAGTHTLMLGGGDLVVMGGSCQRTFRHGIPKVASAGPRIAVMFRPDWYVPPAPTQSG
jgi:alkylated DNA repair dioxygenase AlkB